MDSSTRTRIRRHGLQHYWPLDEASGNAIDRIYGPDGPADGTDTNTVTSAAGPSSAIPLARQFTAASTEKFVVTDRRSVEMGLRARGFSLSAWCYLDTTGALVGVVAKDGGVAGQRSWKLDVLATNVFQFSTFDGSAAISTLSSAKTLSATTWYHVVVVHEYHYVRLYVNGALESGGGGSPTAWGDGTASFQIGQDPAAGVGRYFNGRIAQVILSHDVWTPAEVMWLYNGGRGRDLR